MTRQPNIKRPKTADVRLLPAVIGIGAILFALKAGGLAFPASAATAPAAPPPAQAGAPAAKAAAPAKPAAAAKPGAPADPLAAINAALPMPAKPAEPAAQAKPVDELTADLAASVSSAEMDVLTSLADRRDALQQRQRELELRANIIAATEKRVDEKISQLKALQARIETLLGQRDAKELEQLDGLVKIYAAMKPKDAARIFSSLDDKVRIGVAGRMKADVLAGIMASLPSEVAQKLTVELASRYKAPGEAAVASPDTSTSAAATPPAPAPGG